MKTAQNEGKHTPGPWIVTDGEDGYDIIAAHGVLVAYCGSNHIDEANARLISAAPKLLEALEAVHEASLAVNELRRAPLLSGVMPKVRAAIAKATGKPAAGEAA